MKFREGPVGALLDIYEMRISEVKKLLDENFDSIDGSIEDKDWNLNKTIHHVLLSGFTYAKFIRDQWGGNLGFNDKFSYSTIMEACNLLDEMFDHMTISLDDKKEWKPEYMTEPFESPRGRQYDIEQLVEHAIVHVERHARQIRKYYL